MAAVNVDVKRRAAAAAEVMAKRAPVRAAYLFGSHVQGQADPSSDIDLACFVDGAEDWDVRRETRLIVDVQKQVGFDIEPHIFAASALAHPQPGTLVRDVVRHGVRVL